MRRSRSIARVTAARTNGYSAGVGQASAGLLERRFEVTLRAVKSFSAHRCTILAGGVTYFALVSLFPLMFVALAAIGFIWQDPADQQVLIDNALDALPLDAESGRSDLEDLIVSVVRARGALGLIGILGAAYTGSAMFAAVRHALNQVFEVEEVRPLWRGKLVDLGLVLVFGSLLVVSTGATFGIALVAAFASELFGPTAANLVRWGSALLYLLLPAMLSTLIFLLLYSQVAHAGVTLRESLAGAFVAALGFEGLKVGFAQYVAAFGNYDATYGTLGFVVILLLFFYLSSQLMLFGAEVVRADREYSAMPRLVELTALRRLRGRVWALLSRSRPESTRSVADASAELPRRASSGGRAASAGAGANEGGRRSRHAGRSARLIYALSLGGLAVAGLVRAMARRRSQG